MEPRNPFQRDFFKRLGYPWHLSLLFDYLPDTYLYAKDLDGRFVMVNQTLANLFGLNGPEEVVGRTDYDFSPREMADKYLAEDQRVIRSAKPLVNQAWLIPDNRGELKWYFSSKIPLFDSRSKVIGIAGVMRDVERAGTMLEPYREMAAPLAHVFQHYGDRIEVKELARMVHLSISQFDRRFKQLFQMPPQKFILQVRINAACRLLTATRDSVGKIAQQTGFYDQPHFTRLFKRQTGSTPSQYRKQYQTDDLAEMPSLP